MPSYNPLPSPLAAQRGTAAAQRSAAAAQRQHSAAHPAPSSSSSAAPPPGPCSARRATQHKATATVSGLRACRLVQHTVRMCARDAGPCTPCRLARPAALHAQLSCPHSCTPCTRLCGVDEGDEAAALLEQANLAGHACGRGWAHAGRRACGGPPSTAGHAMHRRAARKRSALRCGPKFPCRAAPRHGAAMPPRWHHSPPAGPTAVPTAAAVTWHAAG